VFRFALALEEDGPRGAEARASDAHFTRPSKGSSTSIRFGFGVSQIKSNKIKIARPRDVLVIFSTVNPCDI